MGGRERERETYRVVGSRRPIWCLPRRNQTWRSNPQRHPPVYRNSSAATSAAPCPCNSWNHHRNLLLLLVLVRACHRKPLLPPSSNVWGKFPLNLDGGKYSRRLLFSNSQPKATSFPSSFAAYIIREFKGDPQRASFSWSPMGIKRFPPFGSEAASLCFVPKDSWALWARQSAPTEVRNPKLVIIPRSHNGGPLS